MFQSADDIASTYFAMRDRKAYASAVDLRMIYGEKCIHCGGPKTLTVRRFIRGNREWHEVCADCHRPWQPNPETDAVVLRGEIQTCAKASAIEDAILDRLELWERVRRVVEPTPDGYSRRKWLVYLRVLETYLHPFCTYELLGRLMGKTEDQVEWVLRCTRKEIEKRAVRSENALMRR